MNITILREQDLQDCIQLDDEVIQTIENAFSQLAAGEAVVPPIVSIEIPERRGELDIKTAYVRGLDRFAIKLASGFIDNEQDGLPVASGMMIVVSTKTGFAEAVLFDNGYLTQVRTAAAGAIAAKYLSQENARTAGIVGAGLQGRYQAQALRLVRDISRFLIFDADSSKAEKYAQEMPVSLNASVDVADDLETLVASSEILVTATPSRRPYIRSDWLHPGLHVTAMGADMEEKQELDPTVFALADIIACDLYSQCSVRGELHHALEHGVSFERGRIVELGELTAGSSPGRTDTQQISICDLTGVGVQDTAIARLAFQKAQSAGLGVSLEV